MKRWMRPMWLLCAAAALFAAKTVLLSGCAADAETGTIRVRVVDGRTDDPLRDAVVVIPETGGAYNVDRNGETIRLKLPVQTDLRIGGALAPADGTVTLLVYCKGYYPLALFHCLVRADTDRNGPTVYLFENDGSLTEPFVVVESPDPGWTARLIDAFEPG